MTRIDTTAYVILMMNLMKHEHYFLGVIIMPNNKSHSRFYNCGLVCLQKVCLCSLLQRTFSIMHMVQNLIDGSTEITFSIKLETCLTRQLLLNEVVVCLNIEMVPTKETFFLVFSLIPTTFLSRSVVGGNIR